MIWCVLDSDERQHANHNVEHGAAACPHTDSDCNHNVELVFTSSLFLDGNKNHNVEHLAQEKNIPTLDDGLQLRAAQKSGARSCSGVLCRTRCCN